jgi:hypothetical protein
MNKFLIKGFYKLDYNELRVFSYNNEVRLLTDDTCAWKKRYPNFLDNMFHQNHSTTITDDFPYFNAWKYYCRMAITYITPDRCFWEELTYDVKVRKIKSVTTGAVIVIIVIAIITFSYCYCNRTKVPIITAPVFNN